MQVSEKAIAEILEDVRGHLVEDMPLLAGRMRDARAQSSEKVAGKLVISIEMVDIVGTENTSPRDDLTVEAKLTLPKISSEPRKVVSEGSQLDLL